MRSAAVRYCWPRSFAQSPARSCSSAPPASASCWSGGCFSGLSAGLATGTATVAVIEAAPAKWRERAPAIATTANIGGLGLGPLLAGLLVQYAPEPLHLAFIVHIVLMGLALACVLSVPETSPRSGSIGFQRLSVPAEVRPVFVVAAIAGFAGFAVTRPVYGRLPAFVAQIIGIENHAVAGAIVCSIFAASVIAQLMSGRFPAAARWRQAVLCLS